MGALNTSADGPTKQGPSANSVKFHVHYVNGLPMDIASSLEEAKKLVALSLFKPVSLTEYRLGSGTTVECKYEGKLIAWITMLA